MKKILLFACLLLSIISCTKEAGLGGQATIEGKVFVLDYNAEMTNKLGEYYGSDIEVFIIYGDDKVYSDDFDTHYDGTYVFNHLRAGKYTVFAYSKDTTSHLDKAIYPIFKTVEITGKKEHIILEDIVIVR
jgi:hypothetical protein